MNEIIKKNSSKFGLIAAGIVIAYNLLGFLLDANFLINVYLTTGLFLLTLALYIISVAQSKKGLGGYINFREAFTAFMLSTIISSLLVTTFSIILYNYIDPEFGVRVKEMGLEKAAELWDKMGLTEEQINEQLEVYENTDNYAIGSQVKTFFVGIVVSSVIGLIVAAVMKKNRPEFPDMEVDNFGEDS